MSGKAVYPKYALDITNWENWGKLVKTWATGQTGVANRASNASSYPWPTTIQELNSQMASVGAGKVPSDFLAVHIVQMSDQLLILALPSKQDILEAEAKIAAISSPDFYSVPPFYKAACGGIELKCAYGNEMKFNTERVGEYVISYCG